MSSAGLFAEATAEIEWIPASTGIGCLGRWPAPAVVPLNVSLASAAAS